MISDSVLAGGSLGSGMGLSSIKLEAPAYYCTSYTPPCSDSATAAGHTQLISTNYGTLSLAPARTSSPNTVAVSLSDNSVIRVKRMRRMSSETEEAELRGDKTSGVSDLTYYTGSPLSGAMATGWSHSDIDHASSLGQFL